MSRNTKKYLTSLVLWPVLGTLIGIYSAFEFGGRGGMFFVFLGFYMGVIGAITYPLYLLATRNSSVNIVRDTFIPALLVLLTTSGLAAFMTIRPGLPQGPDWSSLVTVFWLGGLPTIFVAFLIAILLRTYRG